MFHHAIALAVTLVLATASMPASAPGAGNPEREEFTAIAADVGGFGRAPGITRLDLIIERWSTPEERDRLMEAFRKSPEAALRELRGMPRVGYMRTPTALGYDLRYAFQADAPEGGRQILLATDRPIGFWEARERPRTLEYPFTLIEMRLDDEGEGEGKMSIAARITATRRNGLVLEDYAARPVMLTEIRQRDR